MRQFFYSPPKCLELDETANIDLNAFLAALWCPDCDEKGPLSEKIPRAIFSLAISKRNQSKLKNILILQKISSDGLLFRKLDTRPLPKRLSN